MKFSTDVSVGADSNPVNACYIFFVHFAYFGVQKCISCIGSPALNCPPLVIPGRAVLPLSARKRGAGKKPSILAFQTQHGCGGQVPGRTVKRFVGAYRHAIRRFGSREAGG